MNRQETKAMEKIIKETTAPSAPGAAYTLSAEGMKRDHVEELVPGTPNHQLLDSELYKAGYRRAHQEITERLQWLFLHGDRIMQRDAQRKYAGKV